MSTEENTTSLPDASEKTAESSNVWRKFRAWTVQMDKRQQVDRYLPERDDTRHTCLHCGTAYTGRSCPQCGMAARWKRFTWRLLILNFLDIWGLGNRPMFRTIRDLFWRPGYMMRDYLQGHHLSYFPPFKMLALLTVGMIFLGYMFNLQLAQSQLMGDIIESTLVKGESRAQQPAQPVAPDSTVNGNARQVHLSPQAIGYFKQFEQYINGHILYRILLQNAVVIFAVWLVFRRKSRLNLVETAFAQIYISCQFLIIGIVMMLLMRCFSMGAFSPDVPPGGCDFSLGMLFPYVLPSGAFSAVLIVAVHAYDYHQLYGLRWWPAIWRTLLVALLVLSAFLVMLCGAMLMFISPAPTMLFFSMLAVMAVAGVWLPRRRIIRNKALLPKSVYRASLWSLGLTIMMQPIWISAYEQGKNMILAVLLSLLIMATMSGMSLLVVWLFKRHRLKWPCFVTLAMMLPVALAETALFWELL